MWGLGLGDAFGKPVEFANWQSIQSEYGGQGIQDFPDNAIWTDDTEMTFAVVRALVKDHTQEPEIVARSIADEFIVWQDNPGFSPGNTCLMGTYHYEQTKDWKTSGVKDSKGCGSAMRVAPIGLFYSEEGRLAEVAIYSSVITHAHPTALAAALVAAYLVRLAVDQIPMEEWLSRCKFVLEKQSQIEKKGKTEMITALDKVARALETENDVQAISGIGAGWIGEEAVAMALFCCLRYPAASQFKNAIICAVNHSGDSDSVGCIAGGILGAYHGWEKIAGVVEPWVAEMEEKNRMEDYITQICEILIED